MQPLQLIPDRWLEYEPPSLCHGGVLPIIGAIGSVVGTFTQMSAAQDQADYQAAVARNEAIQQQQKANEDAAIGQRQAITQRRKTDLVLSRARALGAASGTDAASPTQVDIEGQIAEQGGYNALTALYEGMAKSSADTAQANIDLFKADRAESAGGINAMGALFGGVSKLAGNSSFLKLFGDI